MAKKGITAVVAIVLLLMMTVAAAGLAYMWVGGLTKESMTTGSEGASKINEQAQTSLKVDAAWMSGTNIALVIRNLGTTAIDNLGAAGTSYYVDGASVAAIPAFSGVALAPASVTGTLVTNIAMPAVGATKKIRIVRPNGYVLEFDCKRTSSSATAPCVLS